MTTFTLSLDYDYPTALLESGGDGQPDGSTSSSIGRARSSARRPGRSPTTHNPSIAGAGWRMPTRLPPLVDAAQLREWVEEEVLPRALPLLEAYQTVLGGRRSVRPVPRPRG